MAMTLFGQEYQIEDWNVSSYLKELDTIAVEIKKPQVIRTSGFDPLSLHTAKISSPGIVSFLCDELQAENAHDMLLANASEDTAWTAWRNEGLLYTAFRKITLHPDVQQIILREAERCKEMLERFQNEEEAKEQTEKLAQSRPKGQVEKGA